MEAKYAPQAVEEKWQDRWQREKTFEAREGGDRAKYYVLEMFPYPSGKIHMGHVRNYTIGDVVARYKRMQGFNVLHPMGWDAFGMPAENAAIERGVHPAKWTRDNIAYMKDQLRRMGFSYDWSREFATCDPSYYRWEQWLFLKMLEKDLVYRKETTVNWCETCETVLANEQVEQGCCWRCGQEVGQKDLPGWFFRITNYTEELLDWTERLPGWPVSVLTMQRNWIGKSYGTEVDFPLVGHPGAIRVFTTRPDTLYGVTFMSLAVEHPLVSELVRGSQREREVLDFCDRVRREDAVKRSSEDYAKEGVFTGAYVLNRLTGERVPIFVANFVLMGYGTGAVMAVPAHDQRDFEFARKYDLPVRVVIQAPDGQLEGDSLVEAYVGEGTMVNSGPFDGTPSAEGIRAVTRHLEAQGWGQGAVNYRLRDWGISRQRYWGAPIPVIHCSPCGIVPVPEADLPVVLPEDAVEFAGGRVSPLSAIPSFYETRCPRCDQPALRETDTMDTFVESSWYFSRYACADFQQGMLDKDRTEYWMPVDQYIGGIEHAVLHLLYSRFYTKVLRDLDVAAIDEPFTNLLTQGMVCMETQRCTEHGWLFPDDVEAGKCAACGRPAEKGRTEKMSKSKRNVVDPERLIRTYGADTARLFSLFAAPPEDELVWNEEGVEGAYRFLRRIWRMASDRADWLGEATNAGREAADGARALRRKAHETIVRVTRDIEDRFHFNTAIAASMELVNAMSGFEPSRAAERAVFREAFEILLRVLHPMAPHITEELWQALGHPEMLANTPWPTADPEALKKDALLIVVQVNGKVRGRVEVAPEAAEEEVRRLALADENVSRALEGKSVAKAIYVPGRILNLVVR